MNSMINIGMKKKCEISIEEDNKIIIFGKYGRIIDMNKYPLTFS